jgi:hypothetical protein
VSTALRCACCQAFEQPGNGRVLVVDGGGSKRCALLGDNIAEMAHKNGWSVSCWQGLLMELSLCAGDVAQQQQQRSKAIEAVTLLLCLPWLST